MSPAGKCLELVERDPEVGKVAVAEVLDNVGEPLRGEPAVVGEEPMRLLELGQDGEVAGQVPGSAGVCGGSRPCTASNTLSTAAAGPTARSMWGPAAASSARGARIGRTAASSAGSAAWISSRRGPARASARLVHAGTQRAPLRHDAALAAAVIHPGGPIDGARARRNAGPLEPPSRALPPPLSLLSSCWNRLLAFVWIAGEWRPKGEERD